MHEASNNVELFSEAIVLVIVVSGILNEVFVTLSVAGTDMRVGLIFSFNSPQRKKVYYILLKHLCKVSPQLFVLYPRFTDGINLSLFVRPWFSGHAYRVLVREFFKINHCCCCGKCKMLHFMCAQYDSQERPHQNVVTVHDLNKLYCIPAIARTKVCKLTVHIVLLVTVI